MQNLGAEDLPMRFGANADGVVTILGFVAAVGTPQTVTVAKLLGQVLGMTRGQIFFRVVLLQVVKRIVPPMSNEIITLVKDTSLARVITVYEIIWAGQKFIKLDGVIWPLFYTGVFYLLFVGILTIVLGRVEKKLDYFN